MVSTAGFFSPYPSSAEEGAFRRGCWRRFTTPSGRMHGQKRHSIQIFGFSSKVFGTVSQATPSAGSAPRAFRPGDER